MEASVTPIRQLSLDVGGRAPDKIEVGALSWGATVKELDRDLVKGSDVEITMRARVTGGGSIDKYDAHGHVTQTIKAVALRVDELAISAVSVDAYEEATDAPDPEPDPDPAEPADPADPGPAEPDPDPEPDPED